MSRKKHYTSTLPIGLCTQPNSLSKQFILKLIISSIALLVIALPNATTQVFTIPIKNKTTKYTLTDRNTTYTFLSDTFPNNYTDTRPRNSITTICSQFRSKRVGVQFLEFDLAAGDTLYAYDGDTENAPFIGTATGSSNQVYFNGEIYTSYSSIRNPTSCITFVLRTNGDGISGGGWQAEVICAERQLEIRIPTIPIQQFACAPGYALIDIPAAELVSLSGPLNNDSTMVRIINNSTGEVCGETCLSYVSNMTLPVSFSPGNYRVEYAAIVDPSITGSLTFDVVPPPLLCQPIVRLSADNNCEFRITPEMVLEDYCPPIPNIVHYNIIIKDEQDNIISHGNSLELGNPILPVDRMTLCNNAIYSIEIQRVYTSDAASIACGGEKFVQQCATSLVINDQIKPAFLEPIQSYVIEACEVNLTDLASNLPTPLTTDACGASSATMETITPISIDCAVRTNYLITWVATDNCGNSTTRQDTLIVKRPTVFQATPIPDVTLNCNANVNTVNTQRSVSAVLTNFQNGRQTQAVEVIDISLNTIVCDYQLQFEDVSSPSTCGEIITRYWSVVDRCDPQAASIPIDTQIIQLVDTQAPTFVNCNFSDSANPEQIDLPANSCLTAINFPLPQAVDNCDDKPIVREFTVQKLVRGEWSTMAISLLQISFGVGLHRVGYEAIDGCNANADTCYRYFNIQDGIGPIASCQQNIAVILGESGQSSYSAQQLNNNSTDNCGIDLILIKRSSCGEGDQRQEVLRDTTTTNSIDFNLWTTSIDITCCDLGRSVTLDLLVVDGSGNFSSCSVNTAPIQSGLPSCSALAPMSGTCLEFTVTDFGRPTDLNNDSQFDEAEWLSMFPIQANFFNTNFGDPLQTCGSNLSCRPPAIEQEYQLIEGNCGSLAIKRRYRAIDFLGNTSAWLEQDITITYQPDWEIVFPADAFTNCDVDKIEDPKPPILNGSCDDLIWRFSDQIIPFEAGGIREIHRTYDVLNNCLPDGDREAFEIIRSTDDQGIVRLPTLLTAADYPNENVLIYTQIIRFVDNDAPFLVLNDVDLRLQGKGDAAPLNEEDQTRGSAPFECDDIREFSVFARDCNEPSTQNLIYNWEFYINDSTMAIGEGSSFLQPVMPDSFYTVHWSVTDVFGNQTDTTANYQFTDATAPTPLCKKGVTAQISELDRTVQITVDSLNGGSFDNCNDQTQLGLFLFNEALRVDTPTTLTEILALPSDIILGCPEVGMVDILLYTTDQTGNFNFCVSTIEILANPSVNCDETMVGGTITNQFGAPLAEANIEIISASSTNAVQSNEAGNYDMMLPINQHYTVRPAYDKHPLNGVSTYDLILITKHIIGVEFFTSPYQYIAADVNRSGTISVFDIVQLRQLILNQVNHFPNNESWRFINADHEFHTSDPLTENFQEDYILHSLEASNVYMDFIGVKVGDINGDASTTNLQVASPRHSGTTFFIYTPDLTVEKGKSYTIPFHVTHLENIIGLQTTFKFHDLILTNVIGGMVTPDNIHGWRQQSEGLLTTSWHSLLSHDNNALLFSLTFKATANGQLHELLTLTSDPTPAEAYSLSGNRLDLQLGFEKNLPTDNLDLNIPAVSPFPTISDSTPLEGEPLSEEAPLGFELFQNQPNPFQQTTTISFHIPEAALTALRIYTIHGQNIFQTTQHYETGSHQITFVSDQLPNGTYFYQVATPHGVATKRMTIAK